MPTSSAKRILLAGNRRLVGLLLGIVMEGFVMATAEVDQVMFGRDIHAASFIIAFRSPWCSR